MSHEDLQPDGTGFTPYADRNTPPPWARCLACGKRWDRPTTGALESWVQWRLEHDNHPERQPEPQSLETRGYERYRPPTVSSTPTPKSKIRVLRIVLAIPLYIIGGVLFAAGIVGGLFAWIGTVGRLISIDQGFWAFVALVVPPADLVLSFYVGLGGLMIASIGAHLLGRVIFILGGLVNGS